MKVSYINLKVVNISEAFTFYRNALGFKGEVISEEKILLGSKKDTKIQLTKVNEEKEQSNLEMELVMEVKSFEDIIKNQEKYNIKLVNGPIAIYGEYRYVEILDPNGYNLKLVEMI